MITVAIIGGILLLLMMVFLIQMRDRMRDERIRYINALSDRQRKLQNIVEELPPAYIAAEIRTRLLEAQIECLKELQSLQKTHSYRAELEQATSALQTPPKPQSADTNVIIKDEKQALEIRQNLKSLYHFIEGEKREGGLDKSTANRNLAQTAFLIARSMADLHVTKAQQFKASRKFRVAIHHYHNAIEAMEKAQAHPMAQQCIALYRKQIKELDKLATEEAASHAPAAKSESAEGSNALSQELDKILSKEDTWKKKQEYE